MKIRALKEEYLQYISTIYADDVDISEVPIPLMLGFAQTDIGPASLVEKIYIDEKTIAPSLHKMMMDNQQSKLDLQALNVFANEILKYRIVTTDLTTRNIVYGQRLGGGRFFLLMVSAIIMFKVRHLSHNIVKYDQSKKISKNCSCARNHWWG